MGENAIVKLLHATVRVSHVDEAGNALMQAIGFDGAGKPVLAPSTKIVTVEQGNPLPENLAPGEFERLSALGALEPPAKTPATPASATPAEPKAPAKAKAQRKPKTPAVPDPENLPERTIQELADWITAAEPGVRKVIALAGDDAALAGRLIEAEKTATKGDPRTSLVKDLERIAKKATEAAGGGGETS